MNDRNFEDWLDEMAGLTPEVYEETDNQIKEWINEERLDLTKIKNTKLSYSDINDEDFPDEDNF